MGPGNRPPPPRPCGVEHPSGHRRAAIAAAVLIGVVVVGSVGFVSWRAHRIGPAVCEGSTDDLVRAASDGDGASVSAELDRGAAPDHADDAGRTPLYCAAKNGRSGAVRLLLDAGADADPEGADTPLWVASREGRGPVVEVLLDAGARTNLPGRAPLLGAVVGRSPNDDRDLLGLLPVSSAGIPEQEELGSPPRMRAIRALLRAGADPDGGVPTPLAAAVDRRLPEVVDALLDGGASVNHKTKVTEAALRDAVFRGAVPPTGRVTFPPPTPPAYFGDGWYEISPLFVAAQHGDPAMVDQLLRRGADPNQPSLGGYRPLHAGALSDDPDTVRTLLEAGATFDPDAPVPTPLELAEELHRDRAAQVLRS